MMFRATLCLALVVSLSVGASAQVASGARGSVNTLRLLDQRIPEVSFSDAPFDAVMDWVAETSRLNVVVRWESLENAGVPRDKPITLRVKNVRLSQTLWMIMNEAGGSEIRLAYRASGNVLILSTEENLGTEMIVKAYDVSDLLVRVPRFAGPEIDLQQQQQLGGQGGGGGGQGIFGGGNTGTNAGAEGGNDQGNQNEMQQLVDLITSTVEPDTWALNGGPGTIVPFRNQLVIRNNIFVHQRLGGYLRED